MFGTQNRALRVVTLVSHNFVVLSSRILSAFKTMCYHGFYDSVILNLEGFNEKLLNEVQSQLWDAE